MTKTFNPSRAAGLFERTGGIKPSRSVFDLSHSVLLDMNMGTIVPILAMECIPGDVFKLSNQLVIRFQPMVAPILHEIFARIEYFFVPYRILWQNTDPNMDPGSGGWEDFITKGIAGTDVITFPTMPTASSLYTQKGTLWDYLGFPTTASGVQYAGPLYPSQMPFRAYHRIWNDFYRDETLIAETDITNTTQLYALHKCAWEKDYFTSALPWTQRGSVPAIPAASYSSAVFPANLFGSQNTGGAMLANGNGTVFNLQTDTAAHALAAAAIFNDNTVSLSASAFTANDLRFLFQATRWLERNARVGVRYTEFLQGHFGVAPRDERLQRPEWIGGVKYPVIVSEVLQTSGSGATGQTTPQGNMAGHGLTVGSEHVGKYHVQEFGLIMGLLRITPKPMYASQGINRQWLKSTPYDFPFPEFVNMAEQGILNGELYCSQTSNDSAIFGYQGRFDEYRYMPNRVCNNMRDTFDYWHLARIFSSAPALNEAFIRCEPDTRIFADTADPGLIVHVANIIKAIRPLPVTPIPGRIDHN